MSYNAFAEFYDGLTGNVEYKDRAEYIEKLIKSFGREAGTTLDLACGTGSLTLELYRRGFDIFGVDASIDMLSEAQQKCSEDEQILFICQKMQRLNLASEIDTCICTLDSINHLTNPKDVKHNAYFGVADVKIDNKEGSYVVQNPMKSVLSELTVIIENVPKGTEMSGKALDAAWCLFPTQKNGDGDYGLPSIKPTEVEMPTILATESTLKSEVIRLMPTIQGSPASHVYLRLLLPNETLQEYDITAPAMKVGGKYELRLNYNQMQPKMNLEATINGWTNLNNEVEIK